MGAQWAATKGFDSVEIQSDCKEMVVTLTEDTGSYVQRSNWNMQWISLLRSNPHVALVHILREQNSVADFLASLAVDCRADRLFFASPPTGCENLVCNDQVGAVFPCLICEMT
ncbi:uncharacterized protein LOC116029106 [Ipomoea triloba]|uniref:uncharacterized protein LOC116029106 n=1 Tax=Ipomoea triloba TaxID=35885 RepID=UPI00125E4AFE|nr:uncharacterized protein LOC116029106 [Ipomoea triloba]